MSSPNTGAGLRLTIDLRALVRNWQRLAAMVAPAQCAAVVKADAYGLGAQAVVPALVDAGCRTFFVAYASEGARVRQVTSDADIYVLSGFDPDASDLFRSARLRPVLNSGSDVESWTEAAIGGPAALHIDTGMNRLGMNAEQSTRLATGPLRRAANIGLVMSHLACADEPDHSLNALQRQRFMEIAAPFGGVPRSFANSAGIYHGPEYHFEMVRPGIALYGGASHPEAVSEPVVTAEARILQVRTAEKGDTVGYGATRRLERRSRVAIVAAGYADGYLRAAAAGGTAPGRQVWIDGFFAPVLGRVSMDLTAVDVTDIPPERVQPHRWAELFGPNLSIDSAADSAGTIAYELLTRLSHRAERTYLT